MSRPTLRDQRDRIEEHAYRVGSVDLPPRCIGDSKELTRAAIRYAKGAPLRPLERWQCARSLVVTGR